MLTKKVQSEAFLERIKYKIKTIEEISSLDIKACIFTKGVFDLLHYGHLSLINYLGELKLECRGKVIVAVTADSLVKKKKGPSRPINNEQNRALQIACLSQVDYVYIHTEQDYHNSIKLLDPQYYVKGMDTSSTGDKHLLITNNPEIALLSETSTFVVFCDEGTMSTSDIIKKINSI